MLKKIIVGIVLLAALVACSPEETAELPPAESTSESAVNPVEEPVEEPVADEEPNPVVTAVAPSGSVDLGQLTPDAASEGDSDLIVQPAPGVPDPEVKMAQIASQHLAERLGIDISEVTLVEVVEQEWSDSSLGCPSPDALYAAVITPGYQITLEAEGESYSYHTDQNELVVLCVEGLPVED